MADEREFNAPMGGAPDRGERGERGERRGRPGGPRGRFQRRRICQFCVDKVDHIDYKDVNLLRRFISDQGQIDSRRRTGTCAKHQRRVTEAVKRARYLALIPYTAEHVRKFG